MKEAAILFSGGTDSTLAAALALERYDRLHLLTCTRFGLFRPEHTRLNADKLAARFGRDRVRHVFLPVDGIFRQVSYGRYFHYLLKYGFFNLSTCGLCKLAMHLRAAVYCVENGITDLCDGANKGMNLFPDQMDTVIEKTRRMHLKAGVNYTTPVFDFEGPQDIDFADKLHFEKVPFLPSGDRKEKEEARRKTTGWKLYELGLMPSDNVKGTELDRSMQQRCFQFILFNIWLHWYYMPGKSYETYKADSLRYFSEKMADAGALLEEFRRDRERSLLHRLTER